MKVFWTLRYDPNATSYLYSIRGTAKATELREAIKALQFEDDPTEGCKLTPERADRYEFEVAGHWIGIEILIVDKTVRVLYITID